MVNLAFGWLWITLGFLSGMLIGLKFHQAGWLGGYDSLARRMVRLGHIALVMLGVINILFAITHERATLSDFERQSVAAAFIVGAIAMPAVCFLTAWRSGARRLFFIPVASLLYAAITLTTGMVRTCGSG